MHPRKVFFFAILSTLIFPTLAVVTAEVDGSFEVINLNDEEELSFISNLQMDLSEIQNTKILYYTAERGNSNVYTANFSQGGGPETFLASGNSLYELSLPPFLTFDISGPNVVGPVFTLPYGIQNVVINKSVIMSSITSYPEYNFVSVIIDSHVHNELTRQAYVYLAGWDPSVTNNSFVVARTNVVVSSAASLSPIGPSDRIYLSTGSCYDLYDEKKHPHMYLAGGYLIVILTGKCASFARIKLPDSTAPFSSSGVEFKNPNEGESYVSTAAFDSDTSIIYYTVKNFNAPVALVYSFDTKSWEQQPVQRLVLEDLERDTDLIVVFANSSTTKWLVIIGSGSDRIERYTINNDTLDDKTSTYLEDEVNTVYSALYYDPFIYFATYEPDAKLVRLHINNFCNLWCSTNGYCVSESCVCKTGYVADSVYGCITETNTEPAMDPLVLVLAVLSCVAIVVAIIGWAMWFRSRSGYKHIK